MAGEEGEWTTAHVDPEGVARAFVVETLNRTGQIYNYCRYLYDISLRRARGYGSLKAILQVLSDEDGLTLTEVARRVRKGAPTVREYLRALEAVDLVIEASDLYRYKDPVLRYWVAAMTRGIEVDVSAGRSTLAPLLADLEAQQARLTTELGIAKESQLRELLRSFDGQAVDGAWFGVSDGFNLPRFEHVGPYRSADGQVEVDALAETRDGTRWAVELKWRGRAAGQKELASLMTKARELEAQPWFVSRSGFTSGGRTYAANCGVLVSSRADLERIERAVLRTAG
jgi:DNA-binding transcriptional ArsR family regulator